MKVEFANHIVIADNAWTHPGKVIGAIYSKAPVTHIFSDFFTGSCTEVIAKLKTMLKTQAIPMQESKVA